MQYSVYPISMAMFNQKLENCQSVQDISENFKFIITDKIPLVLSVFINATEYLIQSFEDLNFNNWGFFKKKIAQIFPDEQNNAELKWLEKKILIKFRELYSHLAVASKGVNENKNPTAEVDAALSQVSDVFKSSLQERIESAFVIENACKIENKARVLQLSLNFLIVESDLIRHTSPFVEAAFKTNALQNELRFGCDRIIRISSAAEITLFEIPIHLEETEEFSFWLQLSPYLDLSFEGNRLFASLKHIPIVDISLPLFMEFLQNLQKKISNERLHFILLKWLQSLEYEIYFHNTTVNTMKTLLQFVKEIQSYSLLQFEYSREFEFEITPISFYLFKLINDYVVTSLIEQPRDISPLVLQNLRRVLDLWENHKETQSKLFEEANRRLWPLIKSNLKTLSHYNWDLTGPANGISGKMRPYPNVLKILDQTEKADDLAEKTSQISTKSVKSVKIKSTSTQKMNTKKIVPKKTSQQHQNVSHSKINVETKEDSNSIPNLVKDETAKNEPGSVSLGKDKQELDLPILKVLPGETFPFKFDQRVQRWNDHSFGESFFDKEFPEYYDKDLEYQKLMHIFHAPHHLVDRFLSLGIEGTWLNVKNSKNDLRYVIPAEITYKKVRHRGLIVYAIDAKTNVCYHRFFTEKMDQDILYQVVNKVFNENDYPDLRNAVNIGQFPLPKQNVVDSSSICIEAGYVEIVDFDREVKIKLFKVKNV